MKITIVGSGYVGLVSGACFAQMGNEVICFDVDERKISMLQNGEIPIYEKGLKEIVDETSQKGNITFTTSPQEAYGNALLIFIAVGTPMGEDGSADLSYVLSAAKEIGKHLTSYAIIVDKSTVPIGTANLVRETIAEELCKRGVEIEFNVVSNPEFLKEGVAIKDFMSPDRVVIGSDSPKAIKILQELYSPFTLKKERLLVMDIKSAEMTKYAANAMLATKISFINEMARICEAVGADINSVRQGIGSDPRIGYDFIYPGCGYGGSCFPKDVKALSKIASSYGVKTPMLEATESINASQKLILVEKIKKIFGEDLSGKTFGMWGLSFKPETDDMREATSIVMIQALTQMGAKIQAYDPKASENARFYIGENPLLEYCEDKYLALRDCDALIICTEWKEFRSPDFAKIALLLREKIIFDGRNIYHHLALSSFGLKHIMIGKAQ
ncbi:UDP-glucose dehydrogenase family protein [Helicobacter brantae]|uniref:UDP-glucose 6-dehydrogenase n=1 Tax=Helicobacter brantae TaxID=375927 RepID=A0A3D8J4H5_9HELI|nr:UDP-glucose/GDP-mannose dehydrogenase family protein [Helicobacter brantae]RDU72130.1 UDP-glucose 6-dehydrogenase [Helicobacter brantae]